MTQELVEKRKGTIETTAKLPVRFVPLSGEHGQHAPPAA